MLEEENSTFDDLNFLGVDGASCLLKSGDDCVTVKGRLRRALNFWKNIRAPKFILDVIESGYKLPLLQIPTPFAALDESFFVEFAINELISQGCVTEVFEAPVSIKPLSVSFRNRAKSC